MTSTLPHRALVPADWLPDLVPPLPPSQTSPFPSSSKFPQTQSPGRLLGCGSATVWLFLPAGGTVCPRYAFWLLLPAFNHTATTLLFLSPNQNTPPVPQVAEHQDGTLHPCGYLQDLQVGTTVPNSKHCSCLQKPGSDVASHRKCTRPVTTGYPSLQPLFPF